MTCQTCGGPLYADRASMADLALRGYRGGRVYCKLGCTDVWLKVRIPGQSIVTDESKIKIVRCMDCGTDVRTKNRGTKRCESCRKKKALEQGRLAWQRYQEKQRRIA